MDYHVMANEECQRCKQFEPEHSFKHCSFTVSRLENGNALQEFECSKCKFKWERIYESSSNNRPTFRGKAGQSELFESY